MAAPTKARKRSRRQARIKARQKRGVLYRELRRQQLHEDLAEFRQFCSKRGFRSLVARAQEDLDAGGTIADFKAMMRLEIRQAGLAR